MRYSTTGEVALARKSSNKLDSLLAYSQHCGNYLLLLRIYMKKLVLFSLMFITSLACSAQGIYTSIMKYDKFDDVVWKKEKKTLITKTDTTFIIETKGQTPEEYYYVDTYLLAYHTGSKDSIVNLVQDVWGYEDRYTVFTKKDKNDFLQAALEEMKEAPDSLVSSENYEFTLSMLIYRQMLESIDKLPSINIRTTSRYQYHFEYKNDYFWVEFPDKSRIIYIKQ